jgi:hypothetical protein
MPAGIPVGKSVLIPNPFPKASITAANIQNQSGVKGYYSLRNMLLITEIFHPPY